MVIPSLRLCVAQPAVRRLDPKIVIVLTMLPSPILIVALMIVLTVLVVLFFVMFVSVHVVIIIVTLDLKGKAFMVAEFDSLPMVFEVGSSSHPILLTKLNSEIEASVLSAITSNRRK